jgi:hypothetical protein
MALRSTYSAKSVSLTLDELWDEAPLTSIDVQLGVLRRGIVPGKHNAHPAKIALRMHCREYALCLGENVEGLSISI